MSVKFHGPKTPFDAAVWKGLLNCIEVWERREKVISSVRSTFSIFTAKESTQTMTDLKAFLSAYKSAGHKFVPFISDDNDLSELDSTKVMQNDLNAVQQLLKSNSLVFLW